ncbi:MAG TPA: DinB family protein [Phycisphaerae bacterium]|nr:DinB family protein [Phycisphaerae bacterium]
MSHFYELVPEELRRLSHREAVERYVAGAGVPGEEISGLSRAQLLSVPVPGTWSIQQIVLHLMDTDLIAAYRMKRMIAEEEPELDVYDETAFAARVGYERMDAPEASEVFRLNRVLTGQVLAGLPEEAFERFARHPEVGALSLGQLLRLYVHHLNHHMAFLRRKRQMVMGRAG